MIDGQFQFEIINPNPVGGQQVGMPAYHVKCTHLPTGIYAVCMSERSQHRNRAVALAMVQYGLAKIGFKQD